jgi:hypothetical protein
MRIPQAARKLEPSFSWRPIIYCVGLNLVAATAVFMLTLFATGSPRLTVVYTFYTWLVTATASFGFWIWWFFEKKMYVTDKRTKVAFVFSMLLLLAIEWFIVFSVLWYLI